MLLLLSAVLAILSTVAGHSYHLGNCPAVEAQKNFDMDRVSRNYLSQKNVFMSVVCVQKVFNICSYFVGNLMLVFRNKSPILWEGLQEMTRCRPER